MTISELADADKRYQISVVNNAICETRRGIAIRTAQNANTANLERGLTRLNLKLFILTH